MMADHINIDYTPEDFRYHILMFGVALGPDCTHYKITTTGGDDVWTLEVLSPDRKHRECLYAYGYPFRTLADVQRAAIDMAKVA